MPQILQVAVLVGCSVHVGCFDTPYMCKALILHVNFMLVV